MTFHNFRRPIVLFGLIWSIWGCASDPGNVGVSLAYDTLPTATRASISRLILISQTTTGGSTEEQIFFPATCLSASSAGDACRPISECGFLPKDNQFEVRLPFESDNSDDVIFPTGTNALILVCALDASKNVVAEGQGLVKNTTGETAPDIAMSDTDLSACTAALPPECP